MRIEVTEADINCGVPRSIFDCALALAIRRNARRGRLTTIPAWVVSIADYVALIGTEFAGECPTRLCDLRDYILCGDVTANEVSAHGDLLESI